MLKRLSQPDRAAAVAIILTWLIFFSRTIFGRLVYFLDDLKIIYYPLESVYAAFQQSGQVPLWSRFFGFGQPLLAWGQLGFFNPVHLLLRALALPPITLLQISILFYFLLGSVGMYLFLRRQKISAVAASLGAIIFTYAGFHIGHLNHVNFYTATMLLPWLLLSVHLFAIRPGITTILLTAPLAAAVALSGQPQVTLYTFVLAAIWYAILLIKSTQRRRVLLFTILLGLLSFSLASPAILPLAEFLPVTERAFGLGRSEILEFSYPPSHAITLLLPYFFGDHNYYWGAKNFQELAAYTGILPLLLAGLSLFSRRRSLQLFGLAVTIIGILFALGQYTPLFLWLVDAGIVKSLSIPGRFTYFFVVGIAVLSSLGLDATRHLIGPRRIFACLLSLALTTILFIPFISLLANNENMYRHFLSFWTITQPEPFLITFGLLLFLLLCLWPQRPLYFAYSAWLFPAFVALTLILYGWNYNPLTTSASAYQLSPFTDELQSYFSGYNSPPRIYHVEHPSIAARRRTDPISPFFTVIQPVIASSSSLSCFTVPYQLSSVSQSVSLVELSLLPAPDASPLAATSIDPSALNGTRLNVCFRPVPTKPGKQFWLRFSSQGDSGFHLIYQPVSLANQEAYFVRVNDADAAELARSKKPITVLIYRANDPSTDLSALRLDRHINATAAASSANWIAALSIKTYRAFVASLLDDDIDPVHYDSLSIVSDRRAIIDLAGITHLVEQAMIDTDFSYLSNANFNLISSFDINNNTLRLHQNASVFPKAWLVKQAVFSPVDDETISTLRQATASPRDVVYINGPTPPEVLTAPDAAPLEAQATITRYEDTVVDLSVSTNQSAWLVFNDSTTPAWQTYIDSQPAPYYTAFSLFKAAQVPPGQHTVSFRYESKITDFSLNLAAASLLVIISLFALNATRSTTNP